MSGCADRWVDRQPDRRVDHHETYVVRPQDTLYSIAWRHGLDYHDLARWNGIGPDFRISVGQALKLDPGATEAHSLQQRPSGGAQLQWLWPTEPIGAPLPVSGGGILLQGRLGQDVRAASAGRVVYAGTGIRGYGNLIIIKHGENYLSAYAHNRESLVREGEEIALGQVIGKMGEGSPQKPALYFEIRRNGKPVDPLRYLPVTK
ncbi:MAG: peptidoglycan DD-metalloendopeptidase family protein [Rhodanobacter sp.]